MRQSAERGVRSSGPFDRLLRVALFTDTLGDVNGVSRFIQNVAQQARERGRDLRVFTSTRFRTPDAPNVRNFTPLFAAKMPRYEQLEFAVPPVLRMLRELDARPPDVIHVSTPGPVGMVGWIAARMLGAPVLGVYHTDFPAYVDHLFGDDAFTWITARFMRFFYKPFTSIFTRSVDYTDSLVRLGMERERILPLRPGIDTDTFHIRHRDERVWERVLGPGAHPGVKVLYVGRVSVEKTLPLLAKVWARAHARCAAAGVEADLVVVGDGPYRVAMERDLAGTRAHFLGFRHGAELSAIYASSDLFVFPSTTDTLGQVVMEAQSSGLPVLVSDRGGPKEVVAEGRTGHVLDAEDPEVWVEAIVTLVSDRERRRRMGEAAHAAIAPMSMARSFEHFWEAHERAWQHESK